MTIKRSVLEVDSSSQMDFFGSGLCSHPKEQVENQKSPVFKSKNAEEIFIGNQSLKNYLESVGETLAFTVKDLLSKLDWLLFEAKYTGGGRAAYEPKSMLGLILYGIMKGVSSLRSLEQLARIDLGCMWITGGILPDHSIIGRFIQRHSDVISNEFFINLTQAVLQETNSGVSSVAGDGTIIEAAASRYQLVKLESAKEHQQKLEKEYQKNPDKKSGLAVEKAAKAVTELEKRIEKRKQHGKPTETLRISPTEPDAVIQPTKKGKTSLPSYKPSVLANDQRVIVGIDVNPSNEIESLFPMIDMANKIGEEDSVKELLVDAGYHSLEVLKEAVEREINILCPSGNTIEKREDPKKIPKKNFSYDETNDCYICPQGQHLIPSGKSKASGGNPAYIIYATQACSNCPLKERCTSRKDGRQIKRYDGDELKDAMKQVMEQSKAKERFRQRKAMVEPVFSNLRQKQGFNRFRRQGLKSVKVEFALQAMAHNISRVIAYIVLIFYISYINKKYRIAIKN